MALKQYDFYVYPSRTTSGLKARDYFAAQAMQALITANYAGTPADIAKAAYIEADAMLSERKK